MHIANVIAELIMIYIACKVQITLLKANKALITTPIKYSDFTNNFSKKSAVELPKHTKINTYAINLEEGKQPPY